MRYVIQSIERRNDNTASYFAAIHGYSPFYVREWPNGRMFDSEQDAHTYAMGELFTDSSAYQLIPVDN